MKESLTGADNKLDRLLAAEQLLGVDRTEALKALTLGSVDPNPVIRQEVARALAADPKGDRPYLRAFLSDQAPGVRLVAARALALTAAPAAAK